MRATCIAAISIASGLSWRGELLRVAQAIGAWLPAGSIAPPARSAHLAADRHRLGDPVNGISLQVGVRVGGGYNAVPFFFGARVDSDCNWLNVAVRRLDVEPNAEDALLPKGVAFPLLIQRRARAAEVGISGLLFTSTTGTNMCDKPHCGVCTFPSLLTIREDTN
jgi:hypothetical protein